MRQTIITMPLLILLLMLCSSAAQASESLSARMQHVATNAEYVSNQLLAMPADSLTVEDLLILTEAQLRLRNKDAAMSAVNKAIETSEQPYLQAYAYLLKAQVYGILYRDTVIAITQLERSEQLLQRLEDEASLALYSDVLQNFAQAYNQLGNIPKALPYAERSLALAIQRQQPEAELNARITLGRLMLQNNAYSQAYQHLNQALVLATTLQDEEALASIHLRLGMAYRKIEFYPQALEHLQLAKQRYKQLKRQSTYSYTLIYIAETYLEDNNAVAEAAVYLQEAQALATEQNDILRIAITNYGLGRLAIYENNTDLALQYFNDALQLFRQQQMQTYLQETSLALADLLFQRQQYEQVSQLILELTPQMPESATYLRYRFYDLSARLFAQQGDWVKAYDNSQLASTYRFEQLSEQAKFKLDFINHGLPQNVPVPDNSAELNILQQQHQRQQLYLYLLVAACLLFMSALGVTLARLRRQNSDQTTTKGLPANWSKFCQQVQQSSAKAEVNLLAYSLRDSMQLKLRYGEQRLHVVLQQFQLQLPADSVIASCLQDDVLWLAVRDADSKVLQHELLQQLQQLLPEQFANQQLLTLLLPLSELLEKPWLNMEISALREALWLSWALCSKQCADTAIRQPCLMVLHSRHKRACEWRSSMVRQDLLNAIRLGSIKLECDNVMLPATIADQLSAEEVSPASSNSSGTA